MKLSEGSGVIKRVSLPFLLDSSRISNKVIGVLNFNILKNFIEAVIYKQISDIHYRVFGK